MLMSIPIYDAKILVIYFFWQLSIINHVTKSQRNIFTKLDATKTGVDFKNKLKQKHITYKLLYIIPYKCILGGGRLL